MWVPVKINIFFSSSLIEEAKVLGCIMKTDRTGWAEVAAEKGIEFFVNVFSVFRERGEVTIDLIL